MILPAIIAIFGSTGAPGSCSAPCASRHISTAGLRQVSTKTSSINTASLPWCLVMTTASTACGATNEATGACRPRVPTHPGIRAQAARTCAAMVKQIIATIAYAGPRWSRENRVTVVYTSETRSPVPSSVAMIARTTMPGSDLKPATMRLEARVTTLPSAILPKQQTLTQIRPRPGYVGSWPRLSCCRAIRGVAMEGDPRPLRSTSGRECSSHPLLSASMGGRGICDGPTPPTPAPQEARRPDQADCYTDIHLRISTLIGEAGRWLHVGYTKRSDRTTLRLTSRMESKCLLGRVGSSPRLNCYRYCTIGKRGWREARTRAFLFGAFSSFHYPRDTYIYVN